MEKGSRTSAHPTTKTKTHFPSLTRLLLRLGTFAIITQVVVAQNEYALNVMHVCSFNIIRMLMCLFLCYDHSYSRVKCSQFALMRTKRY